MLNYNDGKLTWHVGGLRHDVDLSLTTMQGYD